MSHATDMLTLYQDAEKKILEGQRVFWGERRLYRADLGEVRRGVLYWEHRVAREQQVAAGGTPGAAVADFSDGQASSRNPNGPWVSG